MKHIYKCPSCLKYTMKGRCACSMETIIARPLKYSPDDNVAQYRRQAKMPQYKKRGLI